LTDAPEPVHQIAGCRPFEAVADSFVGLRCGEGLETGTIGNISGQVRPDRDANASPQAGRGALPNIWFAGGIGHQIVILATRSRH